MPKKHFNTQNICIYASELASLIGLNNFKTPSETLFRIWQKNFPMDYEKVFKSLGDSANPLIDNKTSFKKITKKYNKNLELDLDKCIDSNDVDKMMKKRKELMEVCKDMDDKDRKKIEENIINLTNTGFGTKNESRSVHIYTQMTGVPVMNISNFYKRILMKSGDYNWYIGGKIDGICEDKTIIEVKNRMHKLFYNLREYEKIQTFSYMYVLESRKSQLVETYMKGQQPEVNIIDIKFEQIYWDYIFHRITQFVEYFNEFIKNDTLKKELLTNGVENFKINIYK
jgi:hypothetical protein